MTNEEIAKAVTRGTTTRAERVKVLYNDGSTVLVKWPGENIGNVLFRDWVSSWVDLYEVENLNKTAGFRGSKEVWNCARDKDGVLTPKRLRALVEKLELFPEAIQQ